ncbi:hypothetical protein COLO4_07094 [Corchorus olitorius]|uniref:Uncharacterized protein n=1 Tax=Corchorus olitorius TaxID=93759 RepID=A0A1R3KL04_9ROSI|nr:hypothetical protein COLO4_07094 [Corchorus olitorius]
MKKTVMVNLLICEIRFRYMCERQKDNSMVLALCCPGLNHITNWLCNVDKSKL